MKANCKINLKLKILGTREDGYHILDMIMQEISLYDELEITKVNNTIKNNNQNDLTSASNQTANQKTKKTLCPLDNNNLIIKAAKLMCENYNIPFESLSFNFKKKIPIAAGLGGGSSDCASTIKQINDLYSLNLSNSKMIDLGLKLGADVPFFIEGGIKKCTGIGEIIENYTHSIPLPKYVLLATPKIYISTPKMFKNYDEMNEKNNFPKLKYKSNFENDLSYPAIKEYPIIQKVILEMRKYGAIDSQMSGSGPTVFGFFESNKKAVYAKTALKQIFKNDLRFCGNYTRVG